MPYAYTDLIRRAYRGDLAHRHVTAISQHHRIQASPGYRAAAEYVAAELAAAGLEVAIRRFPADGRARFWTTPSFLEWAGEAACLSLLDAQGQPVELLCDFDAVATSLIQRSLPVEGEFDVVALPGKGGKDPADYAGLDVAGKVVLTNAAPSRVAEFAIREHGAAGILFDGMAAGGRTELDLPDAAPVHVVLVCRRGPAVRVGFRARARGRGARSAPAWLPANRCAYRPASAAVSMPARSRWWRRSSPARPGQAKSSW